MRRLPYLGLGLMVFWTGAYVVVYLARWEWQRALMAGELLLIAMIVLLAMEGARRLAAMERRLTERIEGAARTEGTARTKGTSRTEGTARPSIGSVQLTAVPPRRGPYAADPPGEEAPRFRWLEPDTDAYRVFIPVLLGAGIVVSGLAALVERLATALGRSGVQGGARLPVALTPPSGGVLAGAPDLVPPRPNPKAWLRAATLVLAAALVTALVVDELAERTQDRADRPVAAPASTLVIEADTRGSTGAATADPLVTRLWEYCRGSTRPYVEGGGAVPLGGGRYALVVRPALGEHALRRMRGCLEDATIDRARFRVVSVQPG
ncbi:hypothetical protein [Actinomadura rubrisoli]|uniref:Uncharacterized protein n=1 Tax=Actinomadura rubrisoli TaxID=2530368 RepID=A0A4R5A535_9ACTN|nr:hypothetical protein [Actinomadura rubrisoli]TDD67031.1 hypothetical protein E1298_39775 [Actinomadura rubrisoli]